MGNILYDFDKFFDENNENNFILFFDFVDLVALLTYLAGDGEGDHFGTILGIFYTYLV